MVLQRPTTERFVFGGSRGKGRSEEGAPEPRAEGGAQAEPAALCASGAAAPGQGRAQEFTSARSRKPTQNNCKT